jgi:hypothetical protein
MSLVGYKPRLILICIIYIICRIVIYFISLAIRLWNHSSLSKANEFLDISVHFEIRLSSITAGHIFTMRKPPFTRVTFHLTIS